MFQGYASNVKNGVKLAKMVQHKIVLLAVMMIFKIEIYLIFVNVTRVIMKNRVTILNVSSVTKFVLSVIFKNPIALLVLFLYKGIFK
jgi:hypothetical protein